MSFNKRLINCLAALTLPCLFVGQARAGVLQLPGTIVVMVPSREGLVVAADSRTTIAGIFCDNAFKIIEPRSPPRTAITVTGNGKFISPPGPNVADLCEYVRQAPALLDIGEVVKEYLETEITDVAILKIDHLADRCINATKKFQAAWPNALVSFAGRELFSVVLASYGLDDTTSTIRGFVISLSAETLEPKIDRVFANEITLDGRRDVLAFGETDYLNQAVYQEPGRRFLSEETKRFLVQEKMVRDTDLRDAAAVAINIIEASSKTTALIPAPTGIGGPIDVVVLGQKPQPERLRWKSP